MGFVIIFIFVILLVVFVMFRIFCEKNFFVSGFVIVIVFVFGWFMIMIVLYNGYLLVV